MMEKPTVNNWLSDHARLFFNRKFDILDEFDLVSIDHDFDILKRRLIVTRKEKYNSDEKYLIIHHDTDYYMPHCPYGLSIFNLIKTFTELDISLGTIIFLTSHTGISREFKILIPESEWGYNFPKIIDDKMTWFKYASNGIKAAEPKIATIDDITKHAVCLMGASRVHRNVLYNHITKKKLLSKIAVAYRSQDI